MLTDLLHNFDPGLDALATVEAPREQPDLFLELRILSVQVVSIEAGETGGVGAVVLRGEVGVRAGRLLNRYLV